MSPAEYVMYHQYTSTTTKFSFSSMLIIAIITYPLSLFCDDPSMPAWGRAGERSSSSEAVGTYCTDERHSTYKVKRDGP